MLCRLPAPSGLVDELLELLELLVVVLVALGELAFDAACGANTLGVNP